MKIILCVCLCLSVLRLARILDLVGGVDQWHLFCVGQGVGREGCDVAIKDEGEERF